MVKVTIDTTWSPALAYFVGLITADGSLSKDGRHIDITSKDYDLLEMIKQKMSVPCVIGTKYNGNHTGVYYRLQLSDVAFCRWLQSVGLHPAKSKNLASLQIPRDYFAHFLRGYFDGDGSIWSFWDRRWPNSYMFYLTFTCASPKFIRWLQAKISAYYVIAGCISKSRRSEQLRYGKREARVLYETMYYRMGSMFLVRKRSKIIEIFDEDPYAN